MQKTARRYLEVPLPDGDVARIQSLNELERCELRAGNWRATKDGIELDPEKYATQPTRLIAACVVDESGAKVFRNWQEAGQLDATLSDILEDACRKHCGLDQTAAAKEFEKNSAPTGA